MKKELPALLVSWVYLDKFLEARALLSFRDWALDSGAFSAFNAGVHVELDDYIALCKRLRATDRLLSDIFALDVIGDWRGSMRNYERMRAEGIAAIPTYHIGEPEDVLTTLARENDTIALGGVARHRSQVKIRWAEACFAKVWPKKIHGFGFGSRPQLMALPWYSVDATSWEVRTCNYGSWQSFGGKNLGIRGSRQNLRTEIDFMLEAEYDARGKWAKQLARVGAAHAAPTVRFSAVTSRRVLAAFMTDRAAADELRKEPV